MTITSLPPETAANANNVPPSGKRRVLVATDAWKPQINGVVRTLDILGTELSKMEFDVKYLEPGLFSTLPLPSYPEIKLALNPWWHTPDIIREFDPDAIHIATEGPIGLAARRYCMQNNVAFTTSFHTRFPEYIHARTGLPPHWFYKYLQWFHGPTSGLMVTTHTLRQELEGYGFSNLRLWERGVDLDLFRPQPKDWLDLPRPIWSYVGRVAVEKNLEAFLDLDLPGTKMIVGDGPQLASLKETYPAVHFTGPKTGDELSAYYAASDCFVFPSKTDTFGLVILEALASGVPVAAYPVQGPNNIIGTNPVGALNEDLRAACLRAVEIDPALCREYALRFSWSACTEQFVDNLAFRISRSRAA